MANGELPEETKVIVLDETGTFVLPPTDESQLNTQPTDQGRVHYDTPPGVRGNTITIDFNELTEPQPEPDVCCAGAIDASRHMNGRRTLCLKCATIYQYGFKIGRAPSRRRPRGRLR